MKNGKWRKTGTALKLLWDMDRWLLIHTLIVSLIKSVNPFIGIFPIFWTGCRPGKRSGVSFWFLWFVLRPSFCLAYCRLIFRS